jgi:hypothetical protein
MKSPKGKDLNIFVRFGGTNIKKQKGFGKSDSFHSPPSTKGIYAMPLCAQEFFLIGSIDVYQPGTMPKEPHKKRNYEDTEEVWDKFTKRQKKALSVKRKQFYKNTGNIISSKEKEEVRDIILSKDFDLIESPTISVKSSTSESRRSPLKHINQPKNKKYCTSG